ncbi:aldehyde dehydrogenase family protein [Pelagibius sp. Alg239-R121]|uniref:aldehyde dehydrogenase family protein n=1 Tax=Pelagibius sp. Alg239-R121 TaxID=2993448 RepID=UPI0024A7880E|nr:aldehyde dehydrogenase family protein [Pelagibius sp. Alg239-R121]
MTTPTQVANSTLRCKIARDMILGLNGKWFLNDRLVSSEGSPIEVVNPAYNQKIGHTPNCTRQEVDAAVDCAVAAFPAWAAHEAKDRAYTLGHCASIIRDNAVELAVLLALESGKAHRTECVGEVNLLADIFTYFSSFGTELKGKTVPFSRSVLAATTREPVGSVAGIIPWNMPLMFLGYKVAAPLIAGNTVVLKVPEIVPFTVLKIIEAIGALLPPGVVNAVVGYGADTGQMLVENRKIQKVSFTGSVESGRKVYVTAAKNLKQVNLELGGKSPMLVLPDCDMHTAVYGAVSGIRFTRQAQSCTSSTRVYVPKERLDEFVEKTVCEAGKLKMGDPLDDATDTGAIVSRAQKQRIQGFIDRAIQGNQIPFIAGELPKTGGLEDGAFIQPHFFVDPPHDSEIVQKEVFGPVMCVFGYETLDELVDKANDVEYGLSASIWGKDISTCMHVSKKIEVGFVQINQNAVMLPGLSYAGTKLSGFGSETSLESMMQSFTREKTTIINIGSL